MSHIRRPRRVILLGRAFLIDNDAGPAVEAIGGEFRISQVCRLARSVPR